MSIPLRSGSLATGRLVRAGGSDGESSKDDVVTNAEGGRTRLRGRAAASDDRDRRRRARSSRADGRDRALRRSRRGGRGRHGCGDRRPRVGSRGWRCRGRRRTDRCGGGRRCHRCGRSYRRRGRPRREQPGDRRRRGRTGDHAGNRPATGAAARAWRTGGSRRAPHRSIGESDPEEAARATSVAGYRTASSRAEAFDPRVLAEPVGPLRDRARDAGTPAVSNRKVTSS